MRGGSSKEWRWDGEGQGTAVARTDLPVQWDLGRPGTWRMRERDRWRETERGNVPCVREPESAGFCNSLFYRKPHLPVQGNSAGVSLWVSVSVCTHVQAH